MQKTEKEIVQETLDTYTSHNRSINGLGQCVYLTDDGNKCAFGRCLTDEGVQIVSDKFEKTSAKCVLRELKEETIMKPEYVGHTIEFWRFIQTLHDNANNWDINGPSELGYSFIKVRYPDFDTPTKNIFG